MLYLPDESLKGITGQKISDIESFALHLTKTFIKQKLLKNIVKEK